MKFGARIQFKMIKVLGTNSKFLQEIIKVILDLSIIQHVLQPDVSQNPWYGLNWRFRVSATQATIGIILLRFFQRCSKVISKSHNRVRSRSRSKSTILT